MEFEEHEVTSDHDFDQDSDGPEEEVPKVKKPAQVKKLQIKDKAAKKFS